MTSLNTAVERFRPFKTADEVAEFLEKEGITGSPNNPCGCPVASFLAREVKGAVSVGRRSALVCGDAGHDVDLPVPVTDFIELFDDPRSREAMYPHLVERP